MIVNQSNFKLGREAMMHASFFYYQLIEDGEFSCGQTSYWLFDGCSCWDLIELKVVEPKGVVLGIDDVFIREAVLVYILCMLLNQYEELEPEEYPKSNDPAVILIRDKGAALIPEVSQIADSIDSGNVEQYYAVMGSIFKKYVQGRFLKLIKKVP
ncbi:hypothetical protein J7384_18465 [Endozoicomonas sp. G2_1]|uniref:hypothetical protein n=1 Tax=Endozoicomonas sp. G2_1 TaxID=2821091 RepID=UPI001ADC28E6|nr:hypothetical protein [Endozoicomonas sp. G2_1]MBO9492352.1 hypothetical protein [Endozoicomonas sp. G2_1]